MKFNIKSLEEKFNNISNESKKLDNIKNKKTKKNIIYTVLLILNYYFNT